MLTIRSLALVFLALSATSLSLANPEKPYAPDLYDRDSLDGDFNNLKSNFVKRTTPSDSAKPYSPDLYFRSALEEDESTFPTRSAPETFITQINKRSPSLVCKRDSDCGGAHYCSSGSCFMRKAKRALCSRDSMCNSGFCGSQGACLEKRSLGSTCADSTNACSDDLFCSSVDKKCKQRRGVDEACRFSQGCQEGLTCLNYKCSKSLNSKGTSSKNDGEDFISSLQSKLNDLKESKKNLWGPSPSGSPHKPIWIGKRSENDQSDHESNPISDFLEHLEEQKHHWKPSPSGHHHNPIFLQRDVNEPSQPAPSR